MLEELKQHFQYQLEQTNMWLSFAEAKNAALIALNVALLTVNNNLCNQLLFSLSMLMSLISFTPMLGNKVRQIKESYMNSRNLLYYKDISYEINEKDFIDKTIQKYYTDSKTELTENNMLIDLTKEILINSKIAVRKYKLFKIALSIDIFSFVLLIIFKIFEVSSTLF